MAASFLLDYKIIILNYPTIQSYQYRLSCSK